MKLHLQQQQQQQLLLQAPRRQAVQLQLPLLLQAAKLPALCMPSTSGARPR
jgi:hypothetical protein